MPAFDSTAISHLDTEEVIKPAFFAWLDIVGDPIRATTIGYDVTITGSGDDEFDGTYDGISATAVSISEVRHEEGGSNTVTAALSGLLLPDADLLATIGNASNWQGRVARLWAQIRDENGTPQGGIAPYYTGYMTSLEIIPGADQQTIQISIENYLVSLNEASGRTWQSQTLYDAADTSAAASISSANNARVGQGAGAGAAAMLPPGSGLGARVDAYAAAAGYR